MIEEIILFLTSSQITAINNIVGIISLILSIIVLLNVRKIRSHFMFTARVPDLHRDLKKHASNLANYMNEFDSYRPQIATEIGRIEVIVLSLKRKVDKQAMPHIKSLIGQLKNLEPMSVDKKAVWNLYASVNKVLASVEDLQEDKKWEISP